MSAKLFLVIRVLGEVHGSAGPLPYDIAECQSRAAVLNRDVREKTPPSGALIGNQTVLRGDWTFACEWHETRPAIKETPDAE